MKILSFDVGGSKIAWALVDASGHILTEVKTVSTPQNAIEIENIFRAVVNENDFDGFALATAGVVLDNK